MEKLKALRAGNRAALTRNLRKIKEISETEDHVAMKKLYDSVLKKKDTLQSLDEKILEDILAEDTKKEVVEIDEYYSDLDLELTRIEKIMKIAHTSQNANTPQQSTSNFNPNAPVFVSENPIYASSSLPHINTIGHINKLPKLSLPSFSGDILNWQAFWDSFDSAIHNNPSLNDVQKFNYLKSLLYGDALQMISGFALTNVNYNKAIALLFERYGQEHKIPQTYMQALLDITSPMNTLLSLRNFYDKIEIYVRGLESLGQTENSYENLLIPVILNKLPGEIRKNLAREHGSRNWKLCDLRKALLHEINVMEAGNPIGNVDLNFDMPRNTAAFHTASRNVGIGKHRQLNTRPCVFCNEIHAPNNCGKVKDVKQRLDIIRHAKLCFNCLGRHRVTECKSEQRCRKCSRKHHTSICYANDNADAGKSDTAIGSNGSRPENSTNDDSATVMYSSSVKSSTEVLLKTAIAPVLSGSYCCNANILFDGGAQRSFITKKLAETLDVQPSGSETLTISGFGSNADKTRVLETATVWVETTQREKIPINVLIVPRISVPMDIHRENLTKLPHLLGLKLAHPIAQDGIFEISMLIGADFFWDLVENEIIRGDGRGPIAMKSKLGYLLSGPVHSFAGKSTTSHASMMNVLLSHGEEEFDIERFWKVESLGISRDDSTHESYLEEYMNNSISYCDNKYVAKLPWKDDHEPLPTNYNVAKRRTENVIKQLSNDPFLLKKYGEIINEQEQRGFIEKVDTGLSTSNIQRTSKLKARQKIKDWTSGHSKDNNFMT